MKNNKIQKLNPLLHQKNNYKNARKFNKKRSDFYESKDATLRR